MTLSTYSLQRQNYQDMTEVLAPREIRVGEVYQVRGRSSSNTLVRAYIVDQLRKNNFEALANIHASHEECYDNELELMLRHLSRITEENKCQFEDLLNRLQLNNDNLSETYQAIVNETFNNGISYGRIQAFLMFAGLLAVYCAREGMEERVGEVISWTESRIERMMGWVHKQGGWSTFVDHSKDSWTTKVYILAGVITAVVVGLFLKKLF